MGIESEVSDQARLDWRHFEDPNLSPPLAAALEAFVEHGYHGTTVRDIARRVGLSVPGLYYHYESKQALLVALLQSSIEEALARTRAAAEEAGEDPLARFAALVESSVLFMAHRRDTAFLSSEIRSLEPDNRARYIASRDAVEELVLDAVHQGVAEGVFTTQHPDDACRAVLQMCQGVATWFRLGGEVPAEVLAQRYVGFALGIVGFRGQRQL